MLKTTFCGIKLDNPTILASGILGVSVASMQKAVKGGAGAVTIKSVSPEERIGHNNPTMFSFGEVFMNAVGYSNAGVEESCKEFSNLKELGVPVIGSAIGKNTEEFVQVVEKFSDLDFSAIEIPLSCPHTPGFGTLAGQNTPEATGEIISAVKKACKVPVFVKLSPGIQNIMEVVEAAQKAGVDAINMGNTHGPGMLINIETKQPVMDFKVGGVSGPAIKPISIRCVYDIYAGTKGKIPIIGTGGITTGRDAIEMLMAGASVLGVGTAVYYRGLDSFQQICDEMEEFMKENNYKSIKELVGVAHE